MAAPSMKRKVLRTALWLGVAVLGTSSANASAAQAVRVQAVNIPAQALAATLTQIGRVTDTDIIFAASDVRGKHAPAVRGSYSAEQALSHALSGSRLKMRRTAQGAFLIEADRSTSQAATLNAGEASGGDDIVVTARRRVEKIMDVPVAVTAVTQKTLEHNNVQTLAQLQFLVPSLSTTSVYTRDSVNLSVRGQQPPAASATQAVVAYINEVPLPSGIGGDVPSGPGGFVDLAQVEVLKGPQGTLFGRNTTGGAVLFKTAPPKDTLGASVQLGYGNYNNVEGTAVFNAPLAGDKLLMRLVAAGQKRDGFTHVASTPDRPNGVDSDNRNWYSLRGSFSFRPSSEVQNDLVISYSDYKSNGSPTFLTDLNPSVFLGTIPLLRAKLAEQKALGARDHIAEGIPLVSSGTNLAVQNITRIDLSDNVTFKNIIGYDRLTSALTQDYLGADLNILVNIAQPIPLVTNQYSDEMQLLGKAADGKLDWLVGVFGLKDSSHWAQVSNYGVLSGSKSIGNRESKALFAQGTYDLSSFLSNVRFTAGARYTWDDVRSSAGPCTAPAFTVCTLTESSAKSSAFTWNLSLDWKPSRDTLIYLSSRRGYRAGGFNSATAPRPSYDPEYVTDVELGVKGNWNLGGMPVQLVIDGYRQAYSKIQVIRSVFDPPPATTYRLGVENAGSARIYGAEIEGNIKPIPQLQVGGTFSYLDFKYTSFLPGVDGPFLIKEAPYNRPRYKYSLNGRYTLPLDESIGEISLMANWSWQSATVGLGGEVIDHDGIHDRVNAFGLLNLAVDWSNAFGKPLDISFYMSNVADKLYEINRVTSYNKYGYANTRYGEPRMYGVRLKYRFGSEDNR